MKKIIAVILLSCFSTSLLAAPQSFTFTQGGFAEGATVTGSFTGDDLDHDGQLNSFNGEISAFEMAFSGNSTVAAFSLGYSALYGLVYDLDGGPLGDGLSLGIEGIGADDATYAYIAGPGPFAQCGQDQDCASVSNGENIDFSQELIAVNGFYAAVPLSPAMLIIMTLLLGGLGLRYLRPASRS